MQENKISLVIIRTSESDMK